MDKHKIPAVMYPFVLGPPLAVRMWRTTRWIDDDDDRESGSARMARAPKPPAVKKATVGKIWDPRLKSQRIEGKEREAGWDWRMGTSKRLMLAMPPAARREREMEAVWRRVVVREDIVALEMFLRPGGTSRNGNEEKEKR